ncbi:acylneuraminate cytidylyltransferase family protein [Paenibacillus sp. CMAA1364]
MRGQQNCLAIIPARGGSKGLPRKNILPLYGKPLIEYSIEAALKCGYIDEVAVSTDCEEIAVISRQAGASVPFMRPENLATDSASTMDVLKHTVGFYEQECDRLFDNIILLQPTSPLRNAVDVQEAYRIFMDQEADSLQSVALTEAPPYLLRELEGDMLSSYLKNDREDVRLRRQELKDSYVLNGAIYIVRRDTLMNENTLVGRKNCGYVMPRNRSIDIDSEFDLKWAEFLLKEAQ